MKKVFILLLMLSANKVFSQSQLPPVFPITTDTATYQFIDDKYTQLIEDNTGKLEIQQVSRSPISEKFVANYTRIEGINYGNHFFWIRYRLKNLMNTKVKVCLTNVSKADQSDFYISNEFNKWTHYVTGTLYPNDKSDGLKKINSIPIAILPGEEVMIYNRLKNYYYFNKPKRIEVEIGYTDRVIQENYIGRQYGISYRDLSILFTGILIFGSLLYLFFYFIEKRRIYLYFSLFLFYFYFDGDYFLSDFIFPTLPVIRSVIVAIVNCFGVFLIIQFSRYFFRTFDRFPVWDKALKFIAISQMAEALCSFFIEPYLTGKWSGTLSSLSDLLFSIGLFMLMITYFKFIKGADKLTRVVLISAIPASVNWAFGFGLLDSYAFMADRFGVSPPNFIKWLSGWFNAANLICVMWLALFFSWVLILQFMQLRKENAQQALDKERLAKEKEMERSQLIEQQKIELEKEVEERTAELKHSLIELKSTQTQLIQSEKMASLGELTAGIAHEIQNPLNFVNNFSEVNREMIEELIEELKHGNVDEAISIADDVQQNEGKINHHGKRADFIVKGMLQHSRTSTGERQLTNINVLADEFLKLSYHGLRAKDKSFNAELKTHFDENLPKVNVVPQDIGRVLLNLFNNAFYAVNQKQKNTDSDYKPEVSVSTSTENGSVIIKVKDNGVGIPDAIKEKIMQPFFTTKPTGEGTGLGLSLSYDIVVKGHGGSINVESVEGEGSEFIVKLTILT
ncbi:ATP-binding protein [Mucilaginibacter sp. McL0603]|uniref:ATP-binding protein n=1 Tax=Mucilaginibacter sp. McL0603 TaxID=3415670 RepID=UPI003CF85502